MGGQAAQGRSGVTAIPLAVPPPPPAELHADGCDGTCGVWLAAGTPTCRPYPCRCAETRATAPGWLIQRGDVTCWWMKAGRIRSRCPCWGTPRDGRPGDCCAHHSANPRYVVTVPDIPDPEPFRAPTGPAGWHAPHERADRADDTGDDTGDDGMTASSDHPDEPDGWGEPGDWDEVSPFADWEWPDEVRAPFVRRWQPADVTCPCVLSYAHEKRSVQVHCVSCHRDWANVQTMAMHRRRWTDPCLDPEGIVDCWTGLPLLASRGGIWHLSFDSTYRPAGWTPGRYTTTRRTV